MIKITGKIATDGAGHWGPRILRASDAFKKATGEDIFPGTLNVEMERHIPINEHFRVIGRDIGEEHEDFILEICRINDIWAYRVRPLNLKDGSGGHGDHILEILCKVKLREALESDHRRPSHN